MADRLAALHNHAQAEKALRDAEAALLVAYDWDRVSSGINLWKVPSHCTYATYSEGTYVQQDKAVYLLKQHLLTTGVVLGGL